MPRPLPSSPATSCSGGSPSRDVTRALQVGLSSEACIRRGKRVPYRDPEERMTVAAIAVSIVAALQLWLFAWQSSDHDDWFSKHFLSLRKTSRRNGSVALPHGLWSPCHFSPAKLSSRKDRKFKLKRLSDANLGRWPVAAHPGCRFVPWRLRESFKRRRNPKGCSDKQPQAEKPGNASRLPLQVAFQDSQASQAPAAPSTHDPVNFLPP